MMNITLAQVLALVGKLDDSSGDETPRERFRRFLKENVGQVDQIRGYINECLAGASDQSSRALQDLINHLGWFLGFEVTFGRYQGVSGQIGFDGHWRSPTGYHVVVEVKTSDTYTIRSATLVGYVDHLISEQRIPNWGDALGLYVIGRSDSGIQQLQNAIVAERRTDQLRIISVNALLSLARLKDEYGLQHEDVLSVLRPSGPTIDPRVELMARLATWSQAPEREPETGGDGTDKHGVTKPRKRTQEYSAGYSMRLGGETFACEHAYELMVNTANWLITSGKLKPVDCPVRLEGRGRNTVHSEPSHPDGTRFRAGRQLSAGLWVETHYSRENMLVLARQLLKRCGVSPDELIVESAH